MCSRKTALVTSATNVFEGNNSAHNPPTSTSFEHIASANRGMLRGLNQGCQSLSTTEVNNMAARPSSHAMYTLCTTLRRSTALS
eukprot:1603021-Amphidinium_carterae.1